MCGSESSLHVLVLQAEFWWCCQAVGKGLLGHVILGLRGGVRQQRVDSSTVSTAAVCCSGRRRFISRCKHVHIMCVCDRFMCNVCDVFYSCVRGLRKAVSVRAWHRERERSMYYSMLLLTWTSNFLHISGSTFKSCLGGMPMRRVRAGVRIPSSPA